jgi:hypothetical protein
MPVTTHFCRGLVLAILRRVNVANRLRLPLLLVFGVCTAGLAGLSAQSGVFFTESWDSGTLANSFNSNNYGSLSQTGQHFLDTSVRASGTASVRHGYLTGMTGDSIEGGTQHFGDSPSSPVHSNGAGQHFYDIYFQYKFYYSPGFNFGNGHYKQFMLGTQDERRHDETCCIPFAAHYLMMMVERGGAVEVEAYNKESTSRPFVQLNPNAGGYNDSNRFIVQTGRWYTFEVRRRLNDPGVDNGIFQMWADGVLIADYRNVRFRIPRNGSFGSTATYGSNWLMLSGYTTNTVSQNQNAYYDDVKLSTTYIGAGGTPPPPPPPTAPAAPTNLRVITP